jgi:hypothetical protein
MTRLATKLASIRAGTYKRSDFIIADAKDPDMGSGITGPGPKRNADGTSSRYRTRAEFLDDIQAVVEQDIVDIMLVSASNLELLHERGIFRTSQVKPAIRANDATDCWSGVRHGAYAMHPSRPYRTANLARVKPYTDLGLYSVTFTNSLDDDLRSLDAFAAFRAEAAACDFTYFFEVFNPNVNIGLEAAERAEFVNDCILRCLAGLTKADRPQFLKIPYNGPRALEELASFDPQLVVGVLGGGAGTTRDTFELVHQAERYGARIALFGRKINLAESPLAMVALMRQVADGTVGPEEAVRAYHGGLQKQGIKPARSLEDDRAITEAPLKQAALRQAA